MTERKQITKSSVRNRRIKDEATVVRFIEELSWLLSSYQNLDFRAIGEQIKGIPSQSDVAVISDHISANPNIHFLVGALPQILDDQSIFAANEDIAGFAQQVLGLSVPRWQKKSKYEIIGHVVCSAYKLDDAKLSTLVRALTAVVSGDKIAKQIIKKSKNRASNWNEIIRMLSRVNA